MTVQFNYFAIHRNLQSQVNGSYKTDGAREGKHYSTLFLENKIMMIVNKSCNTTKMVKKFERTDATTEPQTSVDQLSFAANKDLLIRANSVELFCFHKVISRLPETHPIFVGIIQYQLPLQNQSPMSIK